MYELRYQGIYEVNVRAWVVCDKIMQRFECSLTIIIRYKNTICYLPAQHESTIQPLFNHYLTTI
jgi:hypothetical protein